VLRKCKELKGLYSAEMVHGGHARPTTLLKNAAIIAQQTSHLRHALQYALQLQLVYSFVQYVYISKWSKPARAK
jgi:hypothetical protein